jgi:hypothetical protein
VVVRQAVGDGLETELGVGGETGLYGRVLEETAVVVLGVEEGDVDVAGDAEEFGELQHAFDGAL